MSHSTRVGFGCIAYTALLLAYGLSLNSSSPARVLRTASMHDRRADHTATLLPDGRVLIAGGMVENGVFLNSAELYEPQQGTFLVTDNMQSRRVEHTATLLSNGKVLIAGGLAGRASEGGPGVVASTEIYDPATGHFTAGPMMSTPRTAHAAVLLANGKVLVLGGLDNHGSLATAEIYDPASNRFTATANMNTARIARSAVLLQDGRVLVTGGDNGRSAEVYDPAKATWLSVGGMVSVRQKHALTLLRDGRVLITGGAPDDQWHPMRTAELFDPHTNKFTAASDMELPRFKLPAATAVLKNGEVLVAGGAAEVETFDSSTGKFSRSGSVAEPHFFAAATSLSDGRVLITGGYGWPNGRPNGPVSTEQSWIYQP
jgi:Kelch motif/Galactose oxidase, central domain